MQDCKRNLLIPVGSFRLSQTRTSVLSTAHEGLSEDEQRTQTTLVLPFHDRNARRHSVSSLLGHRFPS